MSIPAVPQEKLPADETIHVIEYTNIYKNDKWWCAVVLADSFGHKKVMVYLWQWKEIKPKDPAQQPYFKWVRKQKMGINFRKNWEDMKPIIEAYLTKAGL